MRKLLQFSGVIYYKWFSGLVCNRCLNLTTFFKLKIVFAYKKLLISNVHVDLVFDFGGLELHTKDAFPL